MRLQIATDITRIKALEQEQTRNEAQLRQAQKMESVGRLAGSIKMLRRLIGENIELVWRPGENLWPVKIDPSQIDQILTNLCINARDAIREVGRIDIFTKNFVVDDALAAGESGPAPGPCVVLAVSDNGCGIDTAARERLFEPFFTTKGVGEGTGLGLATVYGIVKQNGGHIDVRSEPGQGATFKIILPMTREAPPQEASPAETSATGSETLLLVEDEAAILQLGEIALERYGYTVLATRTPGEAIAVVEQHTGPIDLMVTDVVMPEMNGKALSARIRQLKPAMKVLYMSGYPADVLDPGEILDAQVDFLPKPFTISALTSAVRRALDRDA